MFIYFLFGRGHVFFCCLGGDGSSLICRSAWLKGPNNKKKTNRKNNTGSLNRCRNIIHNQKEPIILRMTHVGV